MCSFAVRLCEVHSPRYRTWSKIYWNSFGRRAPSNTNDLSVAAAFDLVEVMKELVSRVYDVNCQDADGDTALHAAALHSREKAARSLIIDLRASTTIKARDGNNSLHSAAARGLAHIVELIFEHGGNLEDTNKQGRTPLHRAALFGHPETVKVLLAAGANIDALDERGRTALHLASLLGTEDIKIRHLGDLRPYYAALKMLEESDTSIVDQDNLTTDELYEKAVQMRELEVSNRVRSVTVQQEGLIE